MYFFLWRSKYSFFLETAVSFRFIFIEEEGNLGESRCGSWRLRVFLSREMVRVATFHPHIADTLPLWVRK